MQRDRAQTGEAYGWIARRHLAVTWKCRLEFEFGQATAVWENLDLGGPQASPIASSRLFGSSCRRRLLLTNAAATTMQHSHGLEWRPATLEIQAQAI